MNSRQQNHTTISRTGNNPRSNFEKKDLRDNATNRIHDPGISTTGDRLDLKTFLKTRRREEGLTQGEVATRSGLSLDWYRKIEQGRGSNVSFEVLVRINQALGFHFQEACHLAVRTKFGSDAQEVVTTSPQQEMSDKKLNLVIKIQGRDRIGLLTTLASACSKYELNIYDALTSVIERRAVTLFLVERPQNEKELQDFKRNFEKDLEFLNSKNQNGLPYKVEYCFSRLENPQEYAILDKVREYAILDAKLQHDLEEPHFIQLTERIVVKEVGIDEDIPQK